MPTPKRPERAGVHPCTVLGDRHDLGRLGHDVATVADDDHVVVDELGDLVAQPQRVDGNLVAVQLGRQRRVGLVFGVAQPGRMGGDGGLHTAAGRCCAELFEDHCEVADQPDVDGAVLADQFLIEVQLYDAGIGRDRGPELHTEVEGCAGENHQVGCGQCLPSAPVEELGMTHGQHAPAHTVAVGRDARGLDEGPQRFTPSLHLTGGPAMTMGRSASAISSAAAATEASSAP